MANTYSWVISQLDCYPEHEGRQNVVFVVHWRRQATDGAGHSADVYGAQNITLDPKAPFVSFDKLTKAQIQGWLVNAMGAERIAVLDAALEGQINSQITPASVTLPPPWA